MSSVRTRYPAPNLVNTYMINQPSIAVLIDCWQTEASNLTDMYDRIIQFLKDTPTIETIVLATYDAQIEHDYSKTIWYQNYRKLYDSATELNNPFKATANIILNYINTGQFQIGMRRMVELEKYLSLNRHIKNIYVFGSAWDVCVRARPLGYTALQNLLDINILTNTECILNFEGNKPVMENFWVPVTDNIYYLDKQQYKLTLTV
jgi:hypothetical protein